MILAELNIRHTRRHMPTRRVALDASYLPMNGSAHGAALLMAVVAENVEGLDEEQRELLPKLLKVAADGLSVPRIGLRYRLQTDVHGLDLSRHRLVEDNGLLVVELGQRLRHDRAEQHRAVRRTAGGEVRLPDRDAPGRHVPTRVANEELGEDHLIPLRCRSGLRCPPPRRCDECYSRRPPRRRGCRRRGRRLVQLARATATRMTT